VIEALGWGALAASSLVLGVLLAFARPWSDRLVGSVLAFGAGALISAVSFSLAGEGLDIGSPPSVGAGLAVGALAYYLASRVIDRPRPGEDMSSANGQDLALGSFLDGIPEQLVLGIGIVSGSGISFALLMAIFVSNLPEGIGSAADLKATGATRGRILRLFILIAVACAIASAVGYLLADVISSEMQAGLDGFAAGALLVMMIDSMIPEASRKAGQVAGLLTVVGFAAATALSGT
jgi:ZIP family zinc transporter